MKEFELFGLKFISERERFFPSYYNVFGFSIRCVERPDKLIELSHSNFNIYKNFIQYDWDGNELEEDAVDLLKSSTCNLKYILEINRMIKETTADYISKIRRNQSIIEELDKLDKYRILL
jgi:hypothetical protein